MKEIIAAFSFVFSDDEWFNKALVGGCCLLLAPFGIGLVMILGFQTELTRQILSHHPGMPMWRNTGVILRNGLKVFAVSLVYGGIIVVLSLLAGTEAISVTMASTLAVAHFLLNPLIVVTVTRTDSVASALDPMKLIRSAPLPFIRYLAMVVLTSLLILASVLFGWMFIVVGWPLVVFLMMMVQTASMVS